MIASLPWATAGKALVKIAIGLCIVVGAILLVRWAVPERQAVARKDEHTAAIASQAVGTAVADTNRDATIHLDLTQKDVRDAFAQAPTPAPAQPAAAGRDPLPAAPVDRLRNSLNESIARANRAADAACAPD